jgi:recombination protein RecR
MLQTRKFVAICSNKLREDSLLCIVENFRDVIAIENTEIYRGLYHVLGGIISPIDGVGPDQLNIDSLIARVQSDGIKEVVMAISPTIEGDTTIFYLSKKLQPFWHQNHYYSERGFVWWRVGIYRRAYTRSLYRHPHACTKMI